MKSSVDTLEKEYPAQLDPITLLGVTYNKDSFLNALKALYAPFAAAEAAKKELDNALLDRDALQETAHNFMVAFYGVLAAVLGPNNAHLADYGANSPKPRTPLTSEEKVAAADKGRATREARHTMSAKQKEQIKGSVPSAEETAESQALKGQVRAILAIFRARKLPVSAETQATIEECQDPETLDRWTAAALSVASADALVSE